MIVPKFINIYARIGDDYVEDLFLKDFNNVAINLTNFTVTASFSNSMLPVTTINSDMVHIIPISASITDAVNGKITLSISNAQSSTYKMGRYFLQVNVTDSSNSKIYRAFEGMLILNP